MQMGTGSCLFSALITWIGKPLSENPSFPSMILCSNSCLSFMAIRAVEFSNGGTKLERFLPKNQHTQRNLLNFEKRVNLEASKSAKKCQKVPKCDFQSQFFTSKIIWIFLNFFFNLENWVKNWLSKSAKMWLSKSIFYVKNYVNLSQLFLSWKNINLGVCFLLMIFFENFNF